MMLGGGREKKGDPIDHAVGVILHTKMGDWVNSGDVLCEIHVNDERRLAEVQNHLLAAYTLGDEPPVLPPLIHDILESGA